jgi:hypothetical protein
MKKRGIVFIVCVLLMTSFMISGVFAFMSNSFSIRANGGQINSIGVYTQFEQNGKISFASAFHSDSGADDSIKMRGKGDLKIQTTTSDGKKIVISLKLKEKEDLKIIKNVAYAKAYAYGTYWEKNNKKAVTKKITSETVSYAYDSNANTMSIIGKGELNFEVSGLKGYDVQSMPERGFS